MVDTEAHLEIAEVTCTPGIAHQAQRIADFEVVVDAELELLVEEQRSVGLAGLEVDDLAGRITSPRAATRHVRESGRVVARLHQLCEPELLDRVR